MLDKSIPSFTQLYYKKNVTSDAAIISTKALYNKAKTEPGRNRFGNENAFTSPYSHSTCLKYNENTRVITASGEIGFGLISTLVKLPQVEHSSIKPTNLNLEDSRRHCPL